MSEVFLERAKKQVEEAEKKLADAKVLIGKLRTAGEDTGAIEQRATELEYKIQRYRRAFVES